MNKLMIYFLRIYQLTISPALAGLLGHGCRYYPTCSSYTLESFEKYGFLKGGVRSLRRLLSCHSFGY